MYKKTTTTKQKKSTNNRKKTSNYRKKTLKFGGGNSGGSWWPFNNDTNGEPTVYDKYIEKYKKQIVDLQLAIKSLEDKISKMEIAKESETNIKAENVKLSQLNKTKNEAMKSATDNSWFPNFFK
jgi:hypothetical protein